MTSPPGSSVHGDSSGKNPGVGGHALPPGDLTNPGMSPRSPTSQADSLPAELPGKLLEHDRETGRRKLWLPRVYINVVIFQNRSEQCSFVKCKHV